MLLKHYLERGVSKTELSRPFGVSRRTIHEWVDLKGDSVPKNYAEAARYPAPFASRYSLSARAV